MARGSDESLERLQEQASRLVKRQRGIVAAVVIRADEQPDVSRWDGATGRIAQLADVTLHRMDLGGLHELRLSGPFGHLVALRSEATWLLLLCAESARVEEIVELAQETISEARAAGTEVTR